MSSLFRLLAPPARAIERDSFPLRLEDGRTIEVARVRHPRARRLRLSVDERGARLTLPPRASLASGERFAADQRAWVAAQLARFAPAAAVGLVPGETALLPLRGGLVPLRWEHGRYARVRSDEAGVAVALPATAPRAAMLRALRDFYEAEARADAGRWVARHLPGLPRAPRRVRFRPMSSQWGSLAPDGTVSLDLALVLARASAFEYVVVHELCHLVRPDHSRAFWREVEARFPAWRAERDYFHAEGRALKAGLRALLA